MYKILVSGLFVGVLKLSHEEVSKIKKDKNFELIPVQRKDG